jgi:hypothetical protein
MGISIKWDAGSRFRKWAHCARSGRDLHLPSAPDWVEQAWGWTWGRGRNDNFRCSSPQCLPFRVPSASQPGLLRGGVTSDTSAWWVVVWGHLQRGCPVSRGTKRLFLRILSVDHWLTRCRASLPRCSLRRTRGPGPASEESRAGLGHVSDSWSPGDPQPCHHLIWEGDKSDIMFTSGQKFLALLECSVPLLDKNILISLRATRVKFYDSLESPNKQPM